MTVILPLCIHVCHCQTQECKVHSAELQYLKKQKEKVDEVSGILGFTIVHCVLLKSLFPQLKGTLRDAQNKVDVSKAEITRIKNELSPVEVPPCLPKCIAI